MSRNAAGFVYALTNRAMPGLVKVGFTSLLPEDRSARLYTTGVPLPFDVEYRCLSMQPRAVEQLAHRFLSSHRVTERREFFQTDPEQVIEAIEQANRTLNGVSTYTKTGITRIRAGDRIAVPAEPGEMLLLMRHKDLFRMHLSPPEMLDVLQVHDPRSQLELYGIHAAEQVPGLSDPGDKPLRDPVPYLTRDHSLRNGTIVSIERLVPGDQLLWISAGDPTTSRIFEVQDWCQLVGRTWSPTSLQGQYPPLWNFMDQEPTSRLTAHARERISALPTPICWAEDIPVPPDVQQRIISTQEWHKQLAPTRKQ